MPLGAIRPRDVAAYVNYHVRELSPATVNRDVSILHDVLKTAKAEELVDSNPVEGAARPKIRPRRWRILEPFEVPLVAKAFTDDQASVVFLTLVLTGLRRSELRALRWRDVDLIANVLRVRDSKSEDGIRAIAVTPRLAEEIRQHRRRSRFQGDDELVFCNPNRGTIYVYETYRAALSEALRVSGVEEVSDERPTGRIRPFHDLRHTAITNDAASGSSALAVMTKAGHASMSTTQRYLHLAGVVFRTEAEALERRLLGAEVLPEPSLT